MSNYLEPQRTPDVRSEREFRGDTRLMSLWKRIDVVLILGVLAALVILFGGWYLFVAVGDRLNWFDRPIMTELVDERKLINVRDNLASQVLLDAVFHVPDGFVYLSQTGGTIHVYDPATHLWKTHTPFDDDNPIDSDFVQLRSGCGAAAGVDISDCADSESLWALGADGSLARMRGRRWEIVIGNTRFRGANGQPVQTEELTTAAVSADSRWLMLGTRDNGIGVYNTESREWLSIPDSTFADLPDLNITHLVWWDNYFWIGTQQGLTRAGISNNNLLVEAEPRVRGAILDLDADPVGRLWVLQSGDCQTDGDQCLLLATLDNNSDPQPVVDERNNYPAVNLAALHFAQMQGNALLLAGDAGIYAYDTQLHSWGRLSAEPVLLTELTVDGDGFHYVQDGVVGTVEESVIAVTWSLGDGTVVQLVPLEDKLLAVTDGGNLYSLVPNSVPEQLFARDQTTLDPTGFTKAITFGDSVLFISAEGAMLHDTRGRTYDDIAPTFLPPWLLADDSQIIDTPEAIFVIAGSDAYALPAGEIARASYFTGGFLELAQPLRVAGPVSRVWRWDNNSIGIVDGNGQLQRLVASRNPTGRDSTVAQQTQTGPSMPELASAELLDIDATADGIVVIADRELWQYSLSRRSWQRMSQPVLEIGEWPDELRITNSQMFIRTNTNRLVVADGSSIIGDPGGGFQLANSDISDALVEGAQLYLAGDGLVEAYALDQRLVSNRWKPANSGRVTLQAIIDGRPLALIDNRLAWGDDIIDDASGAVASVSLDNERIWTVRETDSGRYLKGYPRNNPNGGAVCYFRTAVIPANIVHDALVLDDGTIAVASNDGVYFYRPHARSWFGTANDFDNVERIYAVGDNHLLFVDGEETSSQFVLRLVSISQIGWPDSCSIDNVELPATPTDSVRSVAVNQLGASYAWIESNGAVVTWDNGAIRELLAAQDNAPSLANARRLFPRDDHLLVAMSNALYRYNYGNHAWQQIALNSVSDSSIDNINVERQGNRNIVTVAAGRIQYVGEFADGAGSVNLNQVFIPQPESFGAASVDLLDVQARDDSRWTFVLRTGIRYFNPVDRTWSTGLAIPSDGTLEFVSIHNRGVVVADNGRRWQIATDDGPNPNNFTVYDREASDQQEAIAEDSTVVRLTAAGEVQKCSQSGNTYDCALYMVPFLLDPDQVNRAYAWNDNLYFVLPDRVRVHNRRDRTPTQVAPELAQFQPTDADFEYENRRILYNAAAGRVLVVEDPTTVTPFDNIAALALDSDSRPWVLSRSQGWQRIADSQLLKTQFTPDEPSARLFMAQDAEPTAVDDNGGLYIYQNDRFELTTYPLPSEIAPSVVRFLQPAADGGWWALTAGQLHVLRIATCFAPPEPIPTATPLPTATPVPSETATATLQPTATPQPTSTPVPYGCLQLVASTPLAPGSLTEVRASGNRITLSDGSRTVEVTFDGSVLTARDVVQRTVTFPLSDDWPALRSNLVRLPDGNIAYDPVVKLERNGTAMTYSGVSLGLETSNMAVTNSGIMPFQTADALDTSWLDWERVRRAFVVTTGTGTDEFQPAEFIQGGQLLFEPVQAVLAPAPDALIAANQYGLWQFAGNSLALNGRVTYFPATLQGQPRAAHGTIVVNGASYHIDGRAVTSASAGTVYASLGAATLVEQVAARTVSGTFPVGASNPLDALAGSRGFTWDAGRRSLAYDGDQLFILSDAGIHSVPGMASTYDPGPRTLDALNTASLQSDGNAKLYLLDGQEWFVRDAGRWSRASADPHHTRLLLDTPIWRWSLTNGVLDVVLKGDRFDFRVLQLAFGFSADRLRAAAAWNGRVYVLTDAFAEDAANLAELGDYTARRSMPIAADRLQPILLNGTFQMLARYENGNVWSLDPIAGIYNPVRLGDPAVNRRAVDLPRLRMELVNGEMTKSVSVDATDGSGGRWAVFDLSDGQFPFDIVTSLALHNGDLYVGTASGLARYVGASTTSFSQIDALFDLRNRDSGSLIGVGAVGVSQRAPSELVVVSVAGCLVQRNLSMFVACVDSEPLTHRLRLRSALWQWIDDEGVNLRGQYVTSRGTLDTNAVSLTGGRWPHDIISDAVVCNDHVLTLWGENWIGQHDTQQLSLNSRTINYHFDHPLPVRIVCVSQPVAISAQELPAGTYAIMEDGSVLMLSSSNWGTVNDQQVADVREYLTNPPLFYRDHMRLLKRDQAETPLTFERRTLTGEWRLLPWHSDAVTAGWRVPIDAWKRIIVSDDRLWATTSVGLVLFEPTMPVRLNSNSFVVIAEPSSADNVPCPVTDVRVQETRVTLRCNDNTNQVFVGVLSPSHDQGVFAPAEDPFIVQPLIEADEPVKWLWQRVDFVGGKPGRLLASAPFGRGAAEEIDLTGGRFGFDTLTSLALFEDEKLEIGTQDAGWFKVARATSIPVQTLTRPAQQIDAPIERIGIMQLAGDKLLCLHLADGGAVRLATDGVQQASEYCPEYQASSGQWLYEATGGELQSYAPQALGGHGQRMLFDGRFADDIAIGLPLTTPGETRYWLPTKAGVVEHNADLQPSGLHVGPFVGHAAEDAPNTLLLSPGGVPAYVGDNGNYELTAARAASPALWPTDIDGNWFTAVEQSPNDTIRMRFRRPNGQSGWLVIGDVGGQALSSNAYAIDGAQYDRYVERQVAWGAPNPLVYVAVNETVDLQFAGDRWTKALPASFRLVDALVVNDRVLLFGEQDLYDIDLVSAMTELAEH